MVFNIFLECKELLRLKGLRTDSIYIFLLIPQSYPRGEDSNLIDHWSHRINCQAGSPRRELTAQGEDAPCCSRSVWLDRGQLVSKPSACSLPVFLPCSFNIHMVLPPPPSQFLDVPRFNSSCPFLCRFPTLGRCFLWVPLFTNYVAIFPSLLLILKLFLMTPFDI